MLSRILLFLGTDGGADTFVIVVMSLPFLARKGCWQYG